MVLILSKQDIESILDMKTTINAVEEGFRQYELGTIQMPLRPTIFAEEYKGYYLVMPAYIGGMKSLGLKAVTAYPMNPEKYNLPTILATVLLNDVETGKLLAIMEGGSITAMRTGAGSGVATKYLAKKDARVVGVFGAGVQARTQLWAVCEVRDIEVAKVYDVNAVASRKFSEEMGKKLDIDVSFVDSAKAVVVDSDIIVTATTASNPLFEGDWIEAGTHINGIGSHHGLSKRELDEMTIKRSKVVVDSREACLAEAGDIMVPISQKDITEDHIYAELGEIVTGKKPGRTSEEEVTLFKSVGLALQDMSTAKKLYELAQEKKVGQTVKL